MVGPLSDFQHTDLNDRDDVWKFITSINEVSESSLPEKILSTYFDAFWDQLVSRLQEIRETMPRSPVGSDGAPKRTQEELLEEVLQRVRMVERTQQRIGSNLSAVSRLMQIEKRENGLPEAFYVSHPEMGPGVIVSSNPQGVIVDFAEHGTVRVSKAALEQFGRFGTMAEARKYHELHTLAYESESNEETRMAFDDVDATTDADLGDHGNDEN